jgi:type VI secretion system protein ImpM
MPRGLIAAPTPRDACVHLPLGERLDVAPVALALLEEQLRASYRQPVVWCTAGSAHLRPSWLVTEGLPVAAAYTAMLSGRWHDWPWSSREQEPAATVADEPAFRIESAGSTHHGNVRSENQDAYLARTEVGPWMVADGMGGHSDGHVASQMTREALAAVEPEADLARWTERVRRTLAEVNAWLYASSTRAVNPTVTGTTVVVMLLRGASATCLWAGDSRLYRLRAGVLEQLTRDHDDAATGGSGEAGNVITRAVGGRAELELDEIGFDVRAGDRFLLCSDGLYREIEPSEIGGMLATPAAEQSVTTLVQRVLRGPAADNLTAVVVDVRGSAD